MPSPLAVVELRDGGRVRAAVVLAVQGDKLHLLLADGRELRVPLARIVHETGDSLAQSAPTRLASDLAEWERRVEARAGEVDLATLHELVALAGGDAPALEDLATLALGDATPSSRAAVHRAMARPNAWFRYDGDAWHARTAEEIEQEQERHRKARQLEEERATFLHAARARLKGEDVALPPSAAKFLRPLREVAIEGEASRMRKEAAAVLQEISGRKDATATPEESFETLVKLGLLARDENLALLRAGVHEHFPPEVLEDAARLAERPFAEGRLDLRELVVVTVDDASTKEIDDGVSLERTSRGLRLGVHISDAAHFVVRGTPTDLEAQERGTSYYLPERSIPMLPAVLSENAASLVAGEDRPALSFLAEVTPFGEVLDFQVAETIVRVSERMTYEDCEAALSGQRQDRAAEDLRAIAELARHFEAERLAAGASPIRASEMAIDFDEAGEPRIKLIDPGRPARQLVSELMVLANRLAAGWCRARGVPAIYRKQAKPSGAVPLPPRDRIDPVAVHEFRRTLQRTEISLEPGPHSGLGVPAYLQATSPIRRYQDLAAHRIMKASLRGEPAPYTREELQAISASTEAAGRQARQVENETDAYWVLRYLESRIGDVLPAVVVRREDRRSLVELLEIGHVTPIAPRPDHERGKLLAVRVRASKPRRGVLTLEEVSALQGGA